MVIFGNHLPMTVIQFAKIVLFNWYMLAEWRSGSVSALLCERPQGSFSVFASGDNPGQQLYHARAEQLGQLGLPRSDEALSGMGGTSLTCGVLWGVKWPFILHLLISVIWISGIGKSFSDIGKSLHFPISEILISDIGKSNFRYR